MSPDDRHVSVGSCRLLEGRVAIITGAGRGIGAETAKTLARAGAAVSLADVTTSDIDAVAGEIRAAGGAALAVTTDVSDPEQVARLVDETLGAFSRIDILVNNAAVAGPRDRPAWETDLEEWRRAMEINVFGVYAVSRAVIPHMIKRGSGRVINVSSGLSEVPVPNGSAYCTTKAGVNHFTRVVAMELLGTGVTMNAYDPGAVRTGLVGTSAQDARAQEALMSREPSEPAAEILWLCGPETAWLTGQFVRFYDPLVQMGMARQRMLLGPPWWAYRSSR